MEANGWLKRTGDAPHARARQTFRITPEGRRLLGDLRREVTELYEEVVLGREPEHPEAVAPSAARETRKRTKHTTRRRR
jgi:DNA-binding PadR family transcriptional regulator